MNILYNDITKIFNRYSDVLFGVSNIKYCEYSTEYKCAIVYAVPHSFKLKIENYTEERFEQLIWEAQDKVNIINEQMEALLKQYGIKYNIPQQDTQSDEPFSFKYACVNGGLGWIGKNDVFITEEYGPRIRLSAVLIDHDLPIGTPVTTSKCPPECNACVNACPHSALYGQLWNINTKREELIDYKLCNHKRSLYIKTHNRKHSCGYCMVSCPYGVEYN